MVEATDPFEVKESDVKDPSFKVPKLLPKTKAQLRKLATNFFKDSLREFLSFHFPLICIDFV